MRVLLLLICLIATAPMASLAQEPGSNAVPPTSIAAPQAPAASIPAEDITQRLSELEKRLEAKYAARLDAMDTNQKSLDNLVTLAKWVGLVATFVIGGAAVLFGKSLSEMKNAAKLQAISSFEEAIREQTSVGKDLSQVLKTAQESRERLEQIEHELAGYAALKDVAQSAAGFDPLVQYYSLNHEVKKRRPETIRLIQGQSGIDIEQTTHSPEFRQRAAVIFQGLLDAVRSGETVKANKISTNELYNVSATAAEVDLDFVAIELMEAADRIAKGDEPEIRSRLIRQRLVMSRISPEEARDEIGKVLAVVNGYDMHLVVSEAYNIGLRAGDAAGMARFIEQSLRPEIASTSYAKLNGARLLFMGENEVDWALGKAWVIEGLTTMTAESRSARWHSHSLQEIASLCGERPDLWEEWEPMLHPILGKHPDIQSFAAYNGVEVTQKMGRLGRLQTFITAPL